ncbi:MAG: response regulator [Planctomycetes bacterium]|nr:response regulator [Planctomycetota bacterium]
MSDELLKSGKGLQAVLSEALALPVCAVDRTGQIVAWNHGCEKISGFEAYEVIRNNSALKLLFPETEEREKALSDFMDGGEKWEWEIFTKDGESKIVRWTPVRLDGTEAGAVYAIGQDVTKEKLVEDALVRSERLSMVGTLASGIAHQFNNINTIIIANLSFALTEPNLDPELKEKIEKAYSAVQRSGTLTHNLLSFSRPSGSSRLACKLDEVVSDTFRIIRKQFEADGITISFEKEDLPLMMLDAGQIEHVLMNLLTNAHDALAESVRKEINISVGRKDEQAFIRVADTGMGIPKASLGEIFTPFYTTTRKRKSETSASLFGGNGLGLSIVSYIIKQHGGRIDVESKLGQGTCFTVYIPINEAEQVAAPSVISGAPRKAVRTLVVEDEVDIRGMVKDVLEGEGHLVDAYASAVEALGVIGTRPYDLVITDLKMPQVSGEAIVEAVNVIPKNIRPKVMVMTGMLSDSREEHLRNMGVSAMLRKPFSLQVLSDTCNRILSER